MTRRVFLIVLDSFGIGEAPDAANFGDVGANTLEGVAGTGILSIPNMTALGLGSIDGVKVIKSPSAPIASYARLQERSMGKDTTTGHWEMGGVISKSPMPTFPEGFPRELMEAFEKAVGRGTLCNLPYSGTDVIRDYGEEHVKTGNGRQAILNALPAIILSFIYGINLEVINSLSGVNNRLTKRKMESYTMLDDAFNSNILGVQYALEVLNSHNGQKVIITPGLVEMDVIKEVLALKYANMIDDACDACILIKNNFTNIMLNDIKKSKIYIAKTFNEGFSIYLDIKQKDSVLLIENDLPDAY